MATQVQTTRQVLEHHLGALGAGDLDGILSDYTDDSILIVSDGPLRGRQAIRGFFEGVLASLFKPGTYEFTMDTLHVADDIRTSYGTRTAQQRISCLQRTRS